MWDSEVAVAILAKPPYPRSDFVTTRGRYEQGIGIRLRPDTHETIGGYNSPTQAISDGEEWHTVWESLVIDLAETDPVGIHWVQSLTSQLPARNTLVRRATARPLEISRDSVAGIVVLTAN
jgi:hypothetical protein